MNKITFKYFFTSFFISISIFSCKVQEEKKEKIKIPHRSANFLIHQLTRNEFKFNTLSSKANVSFETDKKRSFKANLRIKKDSIIWISISPLLGIEMARVLITRDTIKLINRVNKEYFSERFDYINQLVGADLDYQMLEALLIGNSLSFETNQKKIKPAIDRKKGSYYISTEKKRKVRKELKKDKGKLKAQTQALWIEPITYKISELLLSSSNSNNPYDNSLTGVYSAHFDLNSQLFPRELNFNLNAKTPITIQVTYHKVSMGKSLTFPFKIPSKYVRIKK